MGKINDYVGAIISRQQPYLLRIGLVLMLLPLPAWPSQTALEAAFVYNFTQFIEWPAAPANTPFRLCVLNAKSELKELLQFLNGKMANQQVIEVIYLNSNVSLEALQSCQLLFQPIPFATALAYPLPSGVVLVASHPNPDDPNVSIALQLNHERRLTFSINQSAVAVAGVKVSSQLLKLATNKQEASHP